MFLGWKKAVTLKSYPAQLSLTALVCMMGTLEGSILALVVEKTNASIWSINWDIKLFAAIYGVRKKIILSFRPLHFS